MSNSNQPLRNKLTLALAGLATFAGALAGTAFAESPKLLGSFTDSAFPAKTVDSNRELYSYCQNLAKMHKVNFESSNIEDLYSEVLFYLMIKAEKLTSFDAKDAIKKDDINYAIKLLKSFHFKIDGDLDLSAVKDSHNRELFNKALARYTQTLPFLYLDVDKSALEVKLNYRDLQYFALESNITYANNGQIAVYPNLEGKVTLKNLEETEGATFLLSYNNPNLLEADSLVVKSAFVITKEDFGENNAVCILIADGEKNK